MKFISIFNDVLGPVMRGPSSSHTAGSYRIGKIAADLLGEKPVKAEFVFDPAGSYAKTYTQQGADKAFAAGLTGMDLIDDNFKNILDTVKQQNLEIQFEVEKLENPDHPNTVRIRLISKSGEELSVMGKSTGGGGIEITGINNWPVSIDGKYYEILVETDREVRDKVLAECREIIEYVTEIVHDINDISLLQYRCSGMNKGIFDPFNKKEGIRRIYLAESVFYTKKGEALFSSAEEMVKYAETSGISLGEAALAYEAELLGISRDDAAAEMKNRFVVMKASVFDGLENKNVNMQLLEPSAGKVMNELNSSKKLTGGIHSKAAVYALAAMHISNSSGVVCAAPTGGSAGVIPGLIVALEEEWGLDSETIVDCLFAASAVGLITAVRATFAAEVAGCQVEIGAAGAMASAAVVEALGGNAKQAADAGAISYQNTMGSICDLVQGICEIPCHTRNAAAASSAFVNADLILGGYDNPVPLDETIDAVYSVGKMLPAELRCTALGGLAITPSAKNLCKK
ncbi:L-serine ammonia-lyase, iron-sulfur-dependent, subunit alpha [candidate division KSB1 bacterium]